MALSSEYPAKAAVRKRKRKAHTKSRKGCDNCKLRHEKCDEGKPSCRKCLDFRVCCIYGGRINASEVVLQPYVNASFHVDILPTLSTKQTVLGILNASWAQQPWSGGQDRPAELTSQDLDVLSRFHCRTIPTLSTANTGELYQREAVRLACLHPFLMHIAMSLTMMHDRHLLHSPPPPPSKAELSHLYSGVAMYSKTLSGPMTSSERDAIWTTATCLGSYTLANIDAQTPEQVWPLRKPCESDLDWLAMYDGKRAIWRMVDLARPDSCLRSTVEDVNFMHNMLAPDPLLKQLPRKLTELLGLCGDAYSPVNPYYIPANIVNNLVKMESNQSTVLCFYSFVSLMPADFKTLVQNKDPYALMLFAHWFALFSQYRAWYMWRRFTLECQAICIYLERHHGHIPYIDDIIDLPKKLSRLV